MYNLPEQGNGIHALRTIRELPVRVDFFTTMIYMHMLKKGGRAVLSPAGG